MIAPLSETLELRLPAALEAVNPATERIFAHLRIRGLEESNWKAIELGIVEGLNNAIKHGCPNDDDDQHVIVRVRWCGGELVVEIHDPGDFEPGPRWGELPEDPLAESGRGGFLMMQSFKQVQHRRDASGHTLRLVASMKRFPEAPAAACETRETLERAIGELETAYETVSGLRFLVSLLARATTLEGLIEPALARLHEIDGYAFALVRMVRRAHLETANGWGARPALASSISLGEDTVESRAVLTLATQRVQSCETLPLDDPLHGAGGPAVVVPICFEHERIGTITVVRPRGQGFFGAGTVALVHTLAEFFGVAWATAQLQARERELEFNARELRVAADMQARLLPASFPRRDDLRFSGACRSAQAVGGDFYDVFDVEQGTVIVIADAMGKGVPAAFVASVLRCAIRARPGRAVDPGSLLTEVNRQIAGDLLAVDVFITALVGFVPAGAGRILLASAGHCPSMIRRIHGEVTLVEGSGMPLGVMADAVYTTTSEPLEPGDAVVLFTDGLYEIGPSEELHRGIEWMRSMVAATKGREADDTVAALLEASRARGESDRAGDDRTLLVCQRAA